MTALAQERLTKTAGLLPCRGTYPIKANVRIFKGSQVGLDSAGRVMPADTIANGCLEIVGKASATYDNRTGSVLGGAAGAVDVEVEFGIFKWANSAAADAIAAANVGQVAYAVDDQTVALTSNGGLRPVAGVICEIESSAPYVWQGPHVQMLIGASGSSPQAFPVRTVRAKSTANIADLGALTVAGFDGLTLVANDRILVGDDQSTGADRGIRVVGTVAAGVAPTTRALDADGNDEIVPGMLVHVSEGTAGADTWWFLATNAPITVGTTSLSFVKIPTLAEGTAASEAAIKAIPAGRRANGQLITDQTNDVAWIFDSGSAAAASAWVLVPDAGTGRWLRNHPSLADLSGVTTTTGARLVGFDDPGNHTANTNAATVLAEILAHLKSAQAHVPFSLDAWREVSSAGAVANTAGIGGVLASDTTPVLGAAATSEAMQIVWAAGNSDIIQLSTTLPPDFDGTGDAILDLFILTDNSGGGGIDAGTFSVLTSWDNGAQVTDTATDATPATTVHKIQATIAAADIPDAATVLNIQLVLGAHAADPVHLLGARLNYKRTLLAA